MGILPRMSRGLFRLVIGIYTFFATIVSVAVLVYYFLMLVNINPAFTVNAENAYWAYPVALIWIWFFGRSRYDD